MKLKKNSILLGNNITTLKTLPDNSVDCCITSPPYYNLRDYGGVDGQIGLEETPDQYIEKLVLVFREVHRVLKDTGTLWINIGDSYNGSRKNSLNTKELNYLQASNTGSHETKPTFIKTMPTKSLIGIPWRFALAMQNEWYLRQDIIWAKTNPMPESVKDRFCKSHEYIFMFSKSQHYYFDHDAALEEATGYDGRGLDAEFTSGDYEQNAHDIQPGKIRKRWAQRGYTTKQEDENALLATQHHGVNILTRPMRTKRDVWFISTESSTENHYAVYPQKLIIPCILCGCPQNGIVLDPFMGSGTTAVVAMKLQRYYLGCEINPDYVRIAENRICNNKTMFDLEDI